MAIQNATVSLRAYFADGRRVAEDVFPRGLNLDGGPIVEIVSGRGPWQSALVVFARRQAVEYAGSADPQEQLQNALATDLERAASWLLGQEDRIAALRSAGLEVDVLVDLWIDQDQMDWSFPAPFLLACGQAHLPVRMVTND